MRIPMTATSGAENCNPRHTNSELTKKGNLLCDADVLESVKKRSASSTKAFAGSLRHYATNAAHQAASPHVE
jgi:hypothetical protein